MGLGNLLLGIFVDGKACSNPLKLFSARGCALVGSLRKRGSDLLVGFLQMRTPAQIRSSDFQPGKFRSVTGTSRRWVCWLKSSSQATSSRGRSVVGIFLEFSARVVPLLVTWYFCRWEHHLNYAQDILSREFSVLFCFLDRDAGWNPLKQFLTGGDLLV